MKSKNLPRLPVDKRGNASKRYQAEVVQCLLYKLKTDCRRHITSALSWCGRHLSWAACPTTVYTGGSKRRSFLCRWPFSRTRHNRFCLVFGKYFNIMSALSVHQSPTLPQIIDSRGGWFWWKKGVACACGRMNIYLKRPPFAATFGLFGTKCSVFWC